MNSFSLDKSSRQLVRSIAGDCTDCGICVKECLFLARHGSPLQQAKSALEGPMDLRQPFLCNTCGLCTAVCPEKVPAAEMFTALRGQVVIQGQGTLRDHRPLRFFQQQGYSPLFSWYGLPEGCTTVFFPGCALPGLRPERVIEIYKRLQAVIPSLGVVLDCCAMIAQDLGEESIFRQYFGAMIKGLREFGIETVLVNCPSCYAIFATYGQGLKVKSLYQEFVDQDLEFVQGLQGRVTVHDPCSTRNANAVHGAIRQLITLTGLTIVEMEHHGHNTLCCGEGGGVTCLEPSLSARWGQIRAGEAGGMKIITYCAGCTKHLQPLTSTCHLLDLLFAPKEAMEGDLGNPGIIKTYWNRYLLKYRLRRLFSGARVGRRKRDGRISLQER